MNEFDQELKKRISHIEKILDHYLPKPEGFQKTVLKAMNTTVKAGGKRLRPMLMEETYKMFGGKEKVIEPFMAAIEMIHTYSLIHDDLPALDQRRLQKRAEDVSYRLRRRHGNSRRRCSAELRI